MYTVGMAGLADKENRILYIGIAIVLAGIVIGLGAFLKKHYVQEEKMKNNNTVEACTHCHVCQNQCEFLKKYGIDIGDTEKLKELSYHCFLCGKCTEVCPENIDGREYILNLRREK